MIIIKNILLLIALTYASNSIGCDYPTSVASNDVVKCDGVILTNKQFIDSSNDKKNIRLKDLQITELKTTVELMDIRNNIYKKELDDSRDRMSDLEIKSTFGYVISFSLGAIITGVIAKELVR